MKKNLGRNFLSRWGWLSFIFHLIVISNFYLITNSAKCYATNYIGGMAELLSALAAPNTNTFTATSDITLTQNLLPFTGTSLSLFGNNSRFGLNGTSTYSGINVASGQTLNISNLGSVNSSGTVVDSISNFKKTASGSTVDATTSGAVAYNSGTLNLTNTVFSLNTAYDGGVVYNAGTATITNSNFSNNSNSASGSGGAIYNTGTETISGSTFNSNNSTNGGAIYNSGTSTITNSTFTNNTASTSGGAIYNADATSTLNITADKGVTSFTGNTAGGISNAIYMNGGTLNLNAGNGGYILFNDKISSLNSSSIININKIGSGGSNTIFNNTVSNAKLNLVSGMLTLGKYGNTLANYLSTDVFAISGGDLNTANGIIDTNNVTSLTVTGTPGLYLDANLSNGNSDKINGSGTGTLTVKGVNILADGTSSITAVNGATSPILTTTSLTAYTNGYKYLFSNPSTGVLSVSSQTAASGNGGLYDSVSDATVGRLYRSFAATGDVTLTSNLGSQGLNSSTLTIFGNQKNINGLNGGSNYSGIIVGGTQTLNIFDAGSLDGSGNVLTSINNFLKTGSTDNSVCDAAVVYNSGTLNVVNSVLTANKAYNGGAIYSAMGSTMTINNSDFENNIASAFGGVIYNSGTANIINSIFRGNKASTMSGGVIYNYQSASSILNITGSLFENNSAVFAGAIINRNLSKTNITKCSFINNFAFSSSQGGAIYSEGTGTVTDTESNYTNNTATSGGAIYNTGTMNLTGDTFINNGVTSLGVVTSTQGGAIYNYNSGGTYVGTCSITDGIFTGNTSSSIGGGIYNLASFATPSVTTISTSPTDLVVDYTGPSNAFNATVNTYNNTNFTSNKSANGGAIYNSVNTAVSATVNASDKSATITVNGSQNAISNLTQNTNFTGNIATTDGGAIYNKAAASVSASYNSGNGTATATLNNTTLAQVNISDNVKFTNNTAATNGGAIANYVTSATVTASGAHKVASANGTVTAQVNISGSTNFTNNTAATNGGAIYNNAASSNANNSTAAVSVSGATFTSNGVNTSGTVITANGGAIYNTMSNTSTGIATAEVTVNNSTFNTNKVTSSGGAIYNTGTATLTNDTFSNNTSTQNIAGNANGYGGGIYNTASTLAAATSPATTNENISGSSFTGNIASASATNANATANAYGGAIYNTATTASTTAAATATSTQTISNTTFTNNNANASTTGTGTATAKSYGGAIYNTASTTSVASAVANVNITNSTFTGNTATGTSTNSTVNTYGGAIYNTQSASGGGNATATVTLTNSSFDSNTAVTSGGAIYNNGILNIIADGGTTSFTGNKAAGKSNALFMAGGTVNMNSSSSGIFTFNDKITSSGIANVINVNKTDLGFVHNGEVIFNENVSDATINLYDGILRLGQMGNTRLTDATGITPSNSYLNNVNLNLTGGTLNLQNNNINDVLNLNSFTSAIGTSLNFDADLSNNTNDLIKATSASGTLNVSNLNIVADGNDSTLTLFFNGISPTLTAFNKYTTNYKYSFTPSTTTAGVYNVTRLPASFNVAVWDTAASRSFSATADTNATDNLGPMGGTNSELTINGNNIYNINGVNYTGVSVASGQKLTIDSVGSLNSDGTVKKSWNGFVNTNGGAVNNAGTLKVSNSVIANNTASASGGAIYNSSNSDISGTNFTGNSATDGGAIYNTATTTLANTTFTNNTASTSGGAVYNSNSTTISGTNFTGNSAVNGGAIYNTGTTTLTDTNFTNNTASTSGGAIYNTGTLNIKASAGGTTTFSGNTANGISNAIHLSGGTVHVNTGANGTVTFADKITSSSNANVININGAADATLNTGTVNFNNTVSNATIKLYNGTMALGNDSNLNGNNLELNGGTVNLINNAVGTMSLNTLALNGTTNLKIDADLANSTADKITSSTPVTGTGKLNVNRVNILSDSTTAKNIAIADSNVKNYMQVSASTAESALYKYNLSYDSANGTMGFVNTHQFTPSILTPQVAASVGTYLTQTATYQEIFNNMDSLMFLPSADRLLLQQNNKVASADDNFVFSPTFLPEQSRGLWFKQFTTFENVPLNNGPNVSNVGYGALIGGDTELEYLGHGYSGYLTAYTGYNGSHQNYDSVGTYQNGGLLGLTGTVYKGNFFAALTANVGANNANANTTTGTDNFTLLTAGTAVKTGYNFELFSGRFIIQPSYTMSYTFAKTFDYTTTSGANITSDPLNALQISPGIKFIGNLRNGWQPYTGVSMVWNIMDSQRFYANEVPLPQMSVAPYVEYGVGLQRKWAEKFTGFVQTMLRGGGRNGVAFQFGLRWAIGR